MTSSLVPVAMVAGTALRLAVRLASVPLGVLRAALSYLLDALVWLAVTYAALHRIGAVKRIAQWRAEAEISKLANGALITVGDMNVNIIDGRVIATDLIIHAPKRNEWMWDSPLVARVGRVDVRLNILSCIDVVGPALGFPCKDIHSVVAEDIQVFVEKRRNVFNFHLLDPSLEVPEASLVLESMGIEPKKGGEATAAEGSGCPRGAELSDVEGGGALVRAADGGGSGGAAEAAGALGRTGPPSPSHGRTPSMMAEDKANEIMTHLVGAVSSVGRAATGTGLDGESLITALMNQKAGFVGQLREFQARLAGPADSVIPEDGEGVVGPHRPAYMKKHSEFELLAKDGVKVIQQMGKVLGKNVSDIKEQVDSFQKPPPKKADWVDPAGNDRFRFGRIVVRDARIFTKDMIGVHATGASAGSATGSPSSSRPNGLASPGGSSASGGQRPPSLSGWAEPILIRELAVSGAELCPPMTAKEDDSGLPELGLKIERVLDIVLARLLAETAKSNTGRLLNNAFGEVCTWMERKSGGKGESSQRHMTSGSKVR